MKTQRFISELVGRLDLTDAFMLGFLLATIPLLYLTLCLSRHIGYQKGEIATLNAQVESLQSASATK